MKLRIAHCIETVGLGGVEQRRLLLARELDPKRYEQILICTKTIGTLPEEFAAAGVPLHRIGTFRSILDPKPYRAALRVIREFRPHILHGAVYEGVAVAAICGTLAKTPIMIGEEISEAAGRSWKAHLLFRALLGLTSHAVAVSPVVEDYLIHKLRFPRSSVSLIINGVSPPREIDAIETSSLRTSLGIRDGEIVIGNVARLLDRDKRHSDLLAAFRLLCDRRKNLRLLIVGEGPDRDLLKRLAADLGVSARVIFAGYQADPRPFYTVMNIFALASAHEAFGLVLVEAMYARLPVVATKAGGIPSVVVDNETGFLVANGSPSELADRLLELVEDPILRRRFGEQGFARAHEKFSARRYVGDVDRLYREIAAESACLAR